jgi:uncharacterized membrane protein
MKRNYFLVGMVLTAVAVGASVILYPYLPLQMPTHWNIHGQVDGYGAKSWAAFLGPGFMVFMLVLFRVLPWLSPKRFEVDTFVSTYLYMMVVLLAFFAYIHGLSLWAGLRGPWDISRAIFGGVCLLFALLGNVLGKVRRNFWIGVRTPWTLADERVWYATHRFAAKTFVAGGLAAFALGLVGAPFWVSFATLMAGALTPVVHSLVYYKRLERRGEL